MPNTRNTPKLQPLADLQFEKIYLENFDRLFLYATTITKSDELAKDIVSDVFVDLWKNMQRLAQIKDINSYLFISVKNQAIRTVSNNPENLQNYDFESVVKGIDRINPEEVLLEKELFDFIESVVKNLPDHCQLVFRMAKDQNLSNKEIAEELGVSVATVKSHLLKATATLRTAICEKYSESMNDFGVDKFKIASFLLLSYISMLQIVEV